ncbi:MAG TPA: CapA family protein [Acidimicrobiia bacterium]|jgi:poly-gamma-glutamate capsule biosynthesis protein CapA/YwtB (metallophosphatase superfamily)|nr:CapA family protein [Acidimicrobiia bacterium]
MLEFPQSATTRRRARRQTLMLFAAVAALAATACAKASGGNTSTSTTSPVVSTQAPEPAPEFAPALATVALRVEDETGAPLPNAVAHAGNSEFVADATGTISVEIDQPTLFVVEAPGSIPEPIVIEPAMAPERTMQMLARTGPNGTERIVMHFGGDVMMGRRYVEPVRQDTAHVLTDDGGASARNVVAAIAPLFAAADLSSVNLETVVGKLPASQAYPGKRFLLQSPPVVLAALDELGVDVATLGNNHVNDWQEPGVAATLSALAEAGIAAPGGGLDATAARSPALLTSGSYEIGFLSYTTVTGDFVNDSLPLGDESPSSALGAADLWQYVRRPFAFTTVDGSQPLPAGDYRPGDAWEQFAAIEDRLGTATRNDLWAALTAPGAFPELQDWVARRGHGGAAHFSTRIVEEDVAALRAGGADLVIVQIHGGFQFAEAASEFFARAARDSVEAGADLVVGHHPHVLQGLEWYQDRLIVHSLGNFVFDQDFLSTFPTAVLRTVFEGTELIQAKLYPAVLDAYRPEPVSGNAARRILRTIAERSAPTESSARLPDGSIGVVTTTPPPDIVAAGLAVHNGIATVVRADATEANRDLVPVGELADTLIGVDLFGWGSFEDVEADQSAAGGIHWRLPQSGAAALRSAERAPSGNVYLELTSGSAFGGDTLARPVARFTPRLHRWYEADGEPADDAATFSVHATVRLEGGGEPFVRIDGYDFVDTIPTRDPESTLLVQREFPLDVPADGDWHEVVVDLPVDLLAPGGDTVNALMLYVGLAAPERGLSVAGFDDVAFVEWRPTTSYPPGSSVAVDFIRHVP